MLAPHDFLFIQRCTHTIVNKMIQMKPSHDPPESGCDTNIFHQKAMQNCTLPLVIFGICEIAIGLAVYTFFMDSQYIAGGWWGALLVVTCGYFSYSSQNRKVVGWGLLLSLIGFVIASVAVILDVFTLQLFSTFTGCYSSSNDQTSGESNTMCVNSDPFIRTKHHRCVCWGGKTTSDCYTYTMTNSGDCGEIFSNYFIYLGGSVAFGFLCVITILIYLSYTYREMNYWSGNNKAAATVVPSTDGGLDSKPGLTSPGSRGTVQDRLKAVRERVVGAEMLEMLESGVDKREVEEHFNNHNVTAAANHRHHSKEHDYILYDIAADENETDHNAHRHSNKDKQHGQNGSHPHSQPHHSSLPTAGHPPHRRGSKGSNHSHDTALDSIIMPTRNSYDNLPYLNTPGTASTVGTSVSGSVNGTMNGTVNGGAVTGVASISSLRASKDYGVNKDGNVVYEHGNIKHSRGSKDGLNTMVHHDGVGSNKPVPLVPHKKDYAVYRGSRTPSPFETPRSVDHDHVSDAHGYKHHNHASKENTPRKDYDVVIKDRHILHDQTDYSHTHINTHGSVPSVAGNISTTTGTVTSGTAHHGKAAEVSVPPQPRRPSLVSSQDAALIASIMNSVETVDDPQRDRASGSTRATDGKKTSSNKNGVDGSKQSTKGVVYDDKW